jgi:hypothetical protein
MTTIDLIQPDSDAVRAYFAAIQTETVLTDSPDLLTDQPVTCDYSFDLDGLIHRCETRIVPWFDYCYECATGETCDHVGTDRIQGNGWTACAACGEVIG